MYIKYFTNFAFFKQRLPVPILFLGGAPVAIALSFKPKFEVQLQCKYLARLYVS